jgi:hypothetical protein
MPTFLRVYSNIQSNPMLKKSIEYCCRQFFILHRIPFILQMLGSISQLLDIDEQADITDTNKIQPLSLFRLLISLEQTNIDAMRDDYSILELIKNDSITMKIINTPIVAALGQGTMITPTTIKPLDFCYADDETTFTLLNCFDVCVTVGKLRVEKLQTNMAAHQRANRTELFRFGSTEFLKSRFGFGSVRFG